MPACDLLWAPDVGRMYPAGFATTISVGGVSKDCDGAARPGHFDGVATVVAKLFNQVRPDIALFGEKDYQQLAVIRRLDARSRFRRSRSSASPTQREADGLALSSRNAYLEPTRRAPPPARCRAHWARQRGDRRRRRRRRRARHGARPDLAAGFDPVDYVELRDAETLAPMTLSIARRGCWRRRGSVEPG